MTVYVDDMKAPYRRMIMCHMIADTDEELHAMALRIGVQRKWHQKPNTPHSHYDICLAKRALAVEHGAVEITLRELGYKVYQRRVDAHQKKQAQNARPRKRRRDMAALP